jgi:adenylate cyclase
MTARRSAGMLLAVGTIVLFAASGGYGLPRVLPFVRAAENWVADLRVAMLSAPQPQHPDIVIIAVTEQTLAALPYRAPVDRALLARLLRRLEEARVRAIGLDILLDQPTEPEKDALLREVLTGLDVPLVAAWADGADGLTERQSTFLAAMLAGIPKGYANLVTDAADGAARWIFPGRPQGQAFVPGFSVALARLVGIEANPGAMAIAYRPSPPTGVSPFRAFPAHNLGALPAPWLAGKIILVGADLPHADRHRTPLAAAFGPDVGRLPGVVIHAHALAQLLDARTAVQIRPDIEVASILALAVFGVLLAVARVPLAFAVAGGATLLAGFWVGAFALFRYFGVLLPLIGPTVAFVLAAGSGAGWVGRRERQQRRFIRNAFARFISPSIVDQLTADPSRLRLGGERREITYMFTDLAGFTSMVETSDPTVVLPLLNRYLDGMCRIALDHQGTIDKIVGDAVVIFFNAPVDQPDHAARAVRCALAMDAFANEFADRQKAAGFPFGITRFGVNTGTAVVGNFGGDRFFDYTGHGDSVNTAARLESANKHLGTRMCVAESTVERCPEVAFRPIGALVLKGKTEAVAVFEPLIPEDAASPETALYREAFELMRREKPEARDAFARLAERRPDDPLARLHAQRLAAGEVGATLILKEK